MGERSFSEPVKATDAVDSVQTVKQRKEFDTRLLAIVSGIVGASVAVVFETVIIILLTIGGKL